MKILEKYWLIITVATGILTYVIVMLLSRGQSIWFDEGYSIFLAKQSFGELLSLTAVDAHPPFYYVLLKLWGDLFGFSEFVLRSLSGILAGGSVAGSLLLMKRLFGVRALLITAPILLLAPFLLRYGYEVRMYALATFIGVMATYTLIRARENTHPYAWWIVYAALVALGMYTLYMTLALWVAHAAWLTYSSVKTKVKITQWRWVYAFAGAVLLFTPYIPTFFAQMKNSALPGMGNELSLPVLADTLSVLATFTPGWQIGGWLTLLVIAALVALSILANRTYKQATSSQKKGLILLSYLVAVPLLFFALTSLPPREPIFVVRYMAHVSVWVYLLVAAVLAVAWSKKISRLTIASSLLVIVTLGIGTFTLAHRGNYIFERDQTPMTQELRTNVICDDNTIIVADDPYTFIDANFYFTDCDMRFYSPTEIEKKGGYAPLHNSPLRIASNTDIHAKRIVHLHWQNPSFVPSDSYKKISSSSYQKQYVDTYELIAE
jgi:uncharacterized membrane protein